MASWSCRDPSEEEVLVSSHVCHPALCNDNLSGLAVATWLARSLSAGPRRYTYRFLFAPATIGAIAWLATNEQRARKIRHGLVIACAGDAGRVTWKRSRRGDSEIDRAAAHVLRQRGREFSIRDFSPYGYDERQYCSPGFNLAVGSLTRTPHAEYPEYHTSGDDLAFVKPWALADSFSCCLEILEVLEGNQAFFNLNPKCEPQLGRRGLYGFDRRRQPRGAGSDGDALGAEPLRRRAHAPRRRRARQPPVQGDPRGSRGPRGRGPLEEGFVTMETLKELLEKDLTTLTDSLREELGAMEGSNLLITGGAGFLGFYLVQSALHWNTKAPVGEEDPRHRVR